MHGLIEDETKEERIFILHVQAAVWRLFLRFKLNTSTTPYHSVSQICMPYTSELINFSKENFWMRKFWRISFNSANLSKFSPSKILYSNTLYMKSIYSQQPNIHFINVGNLKVFLNQALWAAHTRFLKTVFVQEVSVCMYMCPPPAIKNYSREIKPE